MSFVALHEDSNQIRVFIPHVKKLPPNPHITRGTEPLQRALAPPSESTTTDSERFIEPREDKALRHRLIACDQRSFLTGSASADVRAVHIVHAVRSNPIRKREVETLLSQQRIYDTHSTFAFLLDGPTNAILLEASLHVHWELYGTFCIVPSEGDATAMLDSLKAVNAEWTKYDPWLRRPRQLDITQSPFAKPRWDIVVLHPSALLPDRQPLFVAHERTFYVQGQPPPMSQMSWTSWIAYDDHLRSDAPPHDPFPPFVVDNVRSVLHHPLLSSLAMVVNAHYKLDQFMRDHGSSASPRVRWFADQVSQLVTAIFYVPPGNSEAVSQIPAIVARTSESTTITGPHTEQVYSPSGHPGCSHGSASHDEHDVLGAVEPPEAVDEDDGLTDSEFRSVSTKARDPSADPKERADAAMTMIFGTRRFADPYG